MAKFSIIIPVYNTANYILKCLDSVYNQTFKDYEIIVINDGSTDNSHNIINENKKKYNIKYFKIDNQGLSAARNYGIQNASGEYLIFLDSDDFIENKLLEKINYEVQNNISLDVIRYQIRLVDEKYQLIKTYNEKSFSNCNGIDAFTKITKYQFVELACCYAIKRSYFLEKKFKFAKGMYHEDFGLIPLVIMQASSVSSIDYIGYNYLQRNNSIMNNNDYQKTVKKAFDFLAHYKNLYKQIEQVTEIKKEDKKVFYSFIANSVILKASQLKGKDQDEYLKQIKELDVSKDILTDSVFRKLKKILLKFNIKLYLKVMK